MCSAFSPELYDVVNPYVVTHKVASSELTHKRILEKLSSYGKPVILSTACASYKEIDKALELLHPCDVVLMYCVGAYPANLVDLRLIKDLQERYPDNTIGFSDHTKDVMSIPYEAVKKYGAMVIEKHVTFIDDDTPDSPHSLNRMDFMTMCDAIKEGWKLVFGPTREERDMLIKHRRRLIATANIPQGGTLQEGINFGIYRSQIEDTRAIHGFDIDSVNGKQTKVDIKEGFGIAPEDLA
jgi:sialic acid synthase SpsE